jgi:CRP-like cAMP-binding protein/phosphoribosyl 1,2-cyclic phosphodiesterase
VSDQVIHLPHGGTIVRTRAGLVQFGAPPETLKDALAHGLEVPGIFVLPRSWFSRARGATLAELEFPAYYSTFLQGRRLTVVCDGEERRRLHTVLRESLLGPARYDTSLLLDFDPAVPLSRRPDLAAECEWFRRGSGTGKSVGIDDLVETRLYDAQGGAELGQGVRVERDLGAGEWRLLEDGEVMARVADAEPPPPPRVKPMRPPGLFTPPAFGVTVLGSSHGFDPGGKTTGFVLWINHRGVLVDPPPDATSLLAEAGVPAAHVRAVVLTHCHADHDAGVFQKLLEAGRCDLYTTPTILGSFLRKWVAITGETEERLRRLFVFRPVTIGAPLTIHGGEVRFFYSLHSIPTIGFECWYGGKSLAYSSDTLYEPTRFAEMHAAGILSSERQRQLLGFPWHHAVVIHEAGIPPIHTPVEVLAALPESTKRRLRLIHIAEKDVPPGRGLSLARTGFEHTIRLPVREPQHAAALEALDALAMIDLFQDMTVARCREFLTIAHRETVPAGTLLIGEGEPGDRFYVVVAGEATLLKDGVATRTYRAGDFFGETALITGAPRSADIRARSPLTTLAIDKYDFLAFLRGTDLPQALFRLAENRGLPSWELIEHNPVLASLTTQQRTQLQALLEHVHLEPGGLQGDAAWLLDSAQLELDGSDSDSDSVELARGALVGDFDAILAGQPARLPLRVTVPGDAYRLPAPALRQFLELNPGLHLVLAGTRFVD